MSREALLKVRGLGLGFQDGDQVTAVTDRVSFSIAPGEVYGLVGESGCGKTVTSLAVLQLLPRPASRILSGEVLYRGEDLTKATGKRLRQLRGREISMIFQEPGAALNPLTTVMAQLREPFEYHEYPGKPEDRIEELLRRVGFPDARRIGASYPHQLSGGMLQRVMIAMALLLKPKLIIADEPTTALDVTVQAQIMELLLELQQETGTAILMITHNLNLIAQYADRLGVMYAGRIVEEASVEDFLRAPLHPYSRGLLDALPKLHTPDATLKPIPGQVPKPRDYPKGCRFRNRCPQAFASCDQDPELTVPAPKEAETGAPAGDAGDDPEQRPASPRVACFLHHKNVWGPAAPQSPEARP